MALRREFQEALTLLAQGIQVLEENGRELPILVGGAAAEIYTAGTEVSGDLDLLTPFQKELEAALRPPGFEPPSGPGVLLTGLVHPELSMGLQVVSGPLSGGEEAAKRARVVEVGNARIRLISLEDLIADRMGQAYAENPPRNDMLQQARVLYRFAEELDNAYLDKRICEETLNSANLATLEGPL